MIEELKQILTMIQNVPEMVTHVLLGFAVYKTVIFLGTSAGIYGTIRLAINKLYDYKTKKIDAENYTEYRIDDKFMSPATKARFEVLLSEMRAKRYGTISTGETRLSYIHPSDVEHLIKLLVAHEEQKNAKATA